MSSDAESSTSHEDLSPTASPNVSLASMDTEEHNELYDHRQHPDSLPARQLSDVDAVARSQLAAMASASGATNSVRDEIYSGQTIQDKASPMKAGRSGPIYKVTNAKREETHSKGRQSSKAPAPATSGLPRGSVHMEVPVHKKTRRMSSASSTGPMQMLGKTFSAKSSQSESAPREVRRRLSRASLESDNSHLSRESQETEEDVCFPMQRLEHKRINNIDFDELEEFALNNGESASTNANALIDAVPAKASATYANKEGSSSSTSTTASSAALKYTPKVRPQAARRSQDRTTSPNAGIFFGDNKVETDESEYNELGIQDQRAEYFLPDRFSFFCSDNEETIHSPDIPSLVKPGQTFRGLFRDGSPTWWLDCACPTDDEMRCISKAFGLHPLTAEDIRMQEAREKVELFKSYYFVCFHTFESDKESEEFLEPINVYIVVFKEGVLTFHFGPIDHCSNVRRRVRQLRDYVDVTSDWLCYALIDDITDSFAPVIHAIEYEADAIEDSVFMARDMDFAAMLQRIGEGRRKTMTLMRLLSGKADVIKMFAKRCQDELSAIGPALTSHLNIANLQFSQQNQFGPDMSRNKEVPTSFSSRAQPRADIALYLGDIQDHVLTMFQNLLSYEKIFSRSHSNYLAQLQVESFNSNNKTTEMLGKVTLIGTVLVPLNLIPGLFGMNVKVPGNGDSGLGWFFGILGVMVFIAIACAWLASWWLNHIAAPTTLNEAAESGTKSIINSFRPRRMRQDKQFDYRQKSNKSVLSFPTKMSRYN
ncbi:LAMI_0G07074g1_1 [Lachancea mirantina]|uniref:LAMI_0G07074g1_1 n=1 Tax=Lachancea mirantina TaxID=1230905 RepID=A0A1G4K9D2_9SACH|nr:LAMI_0G07074g1_1 [Lachancea mirantina]